jgi:hypothetical protein
MSYNNTPIVEHIIATYKLICICVFFSLFKINYLLAYIKAPPFEPDSPFAGYARGRRAGFEIVGGNI